MSAFEKDGTLDYSSRKSWNMELERQEGDRVPLCFAAPNPSQLQAKEQTMGKIKTRSSWFPSLLDWVAHPGFILFVCFFSCITLSLEMWWVAKEGKGKKDPKRKSKLEVLMFLWGYFLKKKSYLLKDDRLLYSCKLFAPNWQSLAIISCDHCFVFLYLRMGW